jgi:hypothetical protein
VSGNASKSNTGTSGDELQLIRNELKRIKSDTGNINRIITLSSSATVIQEVRKAVGGSKVRAAILMLTRDEISAKDLSVKLGIDSANLAMYMNPLTDANKGFVTVTEAGRQRFFQRAQLVDLIGFETIPEFAELLKKWEESRKKQGTTSPPSTTSTATQLAQAPAKEQSNVS